MITYAHHNNPQFVYFLPPFYIEQWFIIQKIYVPTTEILHFLSGLCTRAVTDQEGVIVMRVR